MVRAVASGARWSSPAVARMLQEQPADAPTLPHRTLSSREHQIFTLLIEGQRVTEIAAQLNLNSSTNSNHIHAIKTKLAARSVADIVMYAHRAGLID